MKCHSPAGPIRLLWSAHPDNGRLVRTDSNRENPAKAPMFLMVLRKWLEGARIIGLNCTEGERVATLHAEGRDELGDPILLHLVIEIMGRHSNIILYNDQGLIIDGIRRYGSHLSRYREVLPGKPYLPPPPMNRSPLPPREEIDLAKLLYDNPEQPITVTLRREVSGVSPLLAEDIVVRSGLHEETLPDQLGEYEIHRIYTSLVELEPDHPGKSIPAHPLEASRSVSGFCRDPAGPMAKRRATTGGFYERSCGYFLSATGKRATTAKAL